MEVDRVYEYLDVTYVCFHLLAIAVGLVHLRGSVKLCLTHVDCPSVMVKLL